MLLFCHPRILLLAGLSVAYLIMIDAHLAVADRIGYVIPSSLLLFY